MVPMPHLPFKSSLPSLLGLALLLWCTACVSGGPPRGGQSEPAPRTLILFAASSLTEAIKGIAVDFQLTIPGVSVELKLAGSQELRIQLEHGAKGDLFLSADQRQMDLVVEEGLVRGTPVVFTTNRLVVIAAKPPESSNGAKVSPGQKPHPEAAKVTGLKDLAAPEVSLALALPEVPAGAYAREAIQDLEALLGPDAQDYAHKVMANVVTLETNVRNVAMKVSLGEVDAGIVYLTDARAPFVTENTFQIPIPQQANQVARYPVVALGDSQQPRLADRFVEFLLSEKGQSILRSYGFGPSPTTGQYRHGSTDSCEAGLNQPCS